MVISACGSRCRAVMAQVTPATPFPTMTIFTVHLPDEENPHFERASARCHSRRAAATF
jgi:hypothetical protein